jgi:hypothetical protein
MMSGSKWRIIEISFFGCSIAACGGIECGCAFFEVYKWTESSASENRINQAQYLINNLFVIARQE